MKKLLFTLVFFAWASSVDATTYYVGKNVGGASDAHGCTNDTTDICLTIARGFAVIGTTNGAGAGHTVKIYAGTYAESISYLQIPTGTSSAQFTVTINGSDSVVIMPATGRPATLNQGFNKGYITIDGLIFDGTNIGPTEAYGVVYVQSGAGIKFTNFEVRNVARMNGILIAKGQPILFQNFSVHDGAFANVGTGGNPYTYPIYNRGSNHTFENGEIYNAPSYGVHNYDTTAPLPAGNTYRSLYIHDTCTDAATCATWAGAGILLGSGGSNQLYNSIIANNGYDGVSVCCGAGTNDNNLIYGNTITGNDRYGIVIYSGYSIDGTQIKNTILYNNTTGTILNGGTGTVEATNFTTDPTFVGGTDYHLQVTSTAKTGGTTLGAPFNVDKDGVARPQGATYAIGAYEYIAAAATWELVVNSINPASGAAITVSPNSNDGDCSGNTPISSPNCTFNDGTFVTLTAAATAGGNDFTSWTGTCNSGPGPNVCVFTMASDKTQTANYSTPTGNVLTLTSGEGSGTNLNDT